MGANAIGIVIMQLPYVIIRVLLRYHRAKAIDSQGI